MHKLMEYVCDELEELERKADKEGKLSMSEIEYADVLAHLKKDILTADAMMDESEYSERGRSYRGGMPYRDGRTMRGSSYARGRGSNARRDSRGRYSSEGGSYAETADEISEKLEELMRQAPDEKSRMEIQRFMSKLEQM